MDTSAGIWIDRKKAVIVFIKDREAEKKVIKSNIDKQLGRHNGIRSITPYEERLIPGDDAQQRILTESLNIYFDKVISCIGDSRSVFIFGPGETKTELVTRLKKNKIKGTIEITDTVDKMTDPQIIAKVKEYYLK
jgi:hypothetical protein